MNMTEVLAEAIPFGRENAISRERLSIDLKIGDRKVRKYIEKARKDGLMIMNFGGGYFQAENLDEISRQYWEDTARALSILERRKRMRAILKAAGRTV